MSEIGGEARDIEIDGMNVRCHVDGPEGGQSVVLVHGAGPDAAGVSWKKAFPELAEEYRVYAMDLPGYGDSDRVPEYITPNNDYYIEMLDGLLKRLEVTEATLVGISKGGGIALGYTLDRPARVSQLVLADSHGLGDRVPGGRSSAISVKIPKLMEGMWWAMRKSRKVMKAGLANVINPKNLTEEFVDDAHREVKRPNSGDAYLRFSRAEMHLSGPRTNYADRLDELPVPTLFVHGEDDPLIPAELSKRAADAAPVAELFTLSECGHWSSREKPEAFNSRLEAWLEN